MSDSTSNLSSAGASAPERPASAGDKTDICRLCLMAAIVFAFGKEALMFI